MKAKRQMTKEETQFARPHYARWCRGEISIEEFVSSFARPLVKVLKSETKPTDAPSRRRKPVRVPEELQPSLFEV